MASPGRLVTHHGESLFWCYTFSVTLFFYPPIKKFFFFLFTPNFSLFKV